MRYTHVIKRATFCMNRTRTAHAAALFVALWALVLPHVVLGQSADPRGKYRELLEEVDRRVTFNDTDLSAEYTITTRKPAGGTSTTVAAMFRRDRVDKFLILVLQPEQDRGKGYLKTGGNIWLYDPVDRSFTFTSARDRFENSNLRNSDFAGSSFSEDYRVAGAREERLGRFETTVLDLEARRDNVEFPTRRIWVSEDRLVRKIEDYSLSGQLMRTTAIPSYQQVGRRWVPALMVIIDHLNYRTVNGERVYERTTVEVENPSLEEQPDALFTRSYLERVSR
jgi:outer membrane lipoprotein-sorting protein